MIAVQRQRALSGVSWHSGRGNGAVCLSATPKSVLPVSNQARVWARLWLEFGFPSIGDFPLVRLRGKLEQFAKRGMPFLVDLVPMQLSSQRSQANFTIYQQALRLW